MSSPAHSYSEQVGVQSVTGTTYTTVLSHSSANFVAGGKYLLLVSAVCSGPNASDDIFMRTIHGATAFVNSEYILEPTNANRRYDYMWFIVWVAVGGENVEFQIKSQSATTVTADQITISAIRMDVDLVENTDWYYAENNVSSALSLTPLDGATVGPFTSAISSNWLVMTSARHSINSLVVEYCSCINSAGTYNESVPDGAREGENATNTHMVTLARVFGNLGAQSQTFKEQSFNEVGVSGNRLTSQIFAIDLTKFRDVAFDFDNTDEVLSGTDWDASLGAVSFAPTVTTDAIMMCMGDFIPATDGQKVVHRLRSDSTDVPASQTSDRWNEEEPADGAFDRLPIWKSAQKSGMTVMTHLVEWEGDGIGTLAGGPSVRNRTIVVFGLELSRDVPKQSVLPYQSNANVVFTTQMPYSNQKGSSTTVATAVWNTSVVTRSQWWPLSAVSSINSNDTIGVDYRYKLSDINGVRLSDETWRNIKAWTSQLSSAP